MARAETYPDDILYNMSGSQAQKNVAGEEEEDKEGSSFLL